MELSAAALGPVEATTRRSRLMAATQWIAPAVAAVAGLSLLCWVLLSCRAGFDFTDEGFYLNWIASPWNYRASLSQFGFVYHPLYLLLGADIALLRQANVLILFALAWLLCGTLFGSIRVQPAASGPASRIGLACMALAAASAVLSFLQAWLPTPNYNSLTLQAMMLAATGGLLAGGERSLRSVAGWIMIGIGGGLAFLAKPPSAAMLGLLLALYLAAAGKFRLRGLMIAVVAAGLLVVIAAFAIDGSLAGFVRRIVDGLDLSNRRLASMHTTGRLFPPDQLAFGSQRRTHFIHFLVVLFVTTGLGLLASRFARPVSLFVAALVAAACVVAMAGLWSPQILSHDIEPLQLLGIAIGAVLAEWLASKAAIRTPSRNGLAIAGLLLALPYAFAFGTDSNYWAAAAHAGLFWLLAGLVICLDRAATETALQKLLPAIGAALVVTTGTLLVATGAPYRQTEALNRQASLLDLPPGKSRLFLSEQAVAYIRALRALVAAAGFREGDPMLDLTGESPGSLYAIGARPLAAPWTLAGYRGSANFVAAALHAESCQTIAASWMLDEPGSADAIPADVLIAEGIDLSADYTVVGSIRETRGVAPSSLEYRVLKPARSTEAARSACEAARRQ